MFRQNSSALTALLMQREKLAKQIAAAQVKKKAEYAKIAAEEVARKEAAKQAAKQAEVNARRAAEEAEAKKISPIKAKYDALEKDELKCEIIFAVYAIDDKLNAYAKHNAPDKKNEIIAELIESLLKLVVHFHQLQKRIGPIAFQKDFVSLFRRDFQYIPIPNLCGLKLLLNGLEKPKEPSQSLLQKKGVIQTAAALHRMMRDNVVGTEYTPKWIATDLSQVPKDEYERIVVVVETEPNKEKTITLPITPNSNSSISPTSTNSTSSAATSISKDSKDSKESDNDRTQSVSPVDLNEEHPSRYPHHDLDDEAAYRAYVAAATLEAGMKAENSNLSMQQKEHIFTLFQSTKHVVKTQLQDDMNSDKAIQNEKAIEMLSRLKNLYI